MDEQQSPQRGLVPPPLPSPGSAGGSHGHEYNIEVKAEAVAGAMREPQNTHPRKAAEAAVTMVKLANVAAHAGHEPAACFTTGHAERLPADRPMVFHCGCAAAARHRTAMLGMDQVTPRTTPCSKAGGARALQAVMCGSQAATSSLQGSCPKASA